MIGLSSVKITDSFFSKKRGEMLKKMLMHQWDALNDFYGEGDSHAVKNLKMAAGVIERSEVPYGDFGKESDLAKWLEAASAMLVFNRDNDIEDKIDYIVDLFEKAQAEDGYLNTYYLASNPDLRFTSISELHEMYCAGHLAEAAVTYREATGKDKFLKIVQQYLDLLIKTFGESDEQLNATPGHEELELALVRVYEATGEVKYINFAKWLVNSRGTGRYYEKEATFRNGSKFFDYDYYQAQAPLKEQKQAVGHAVRAAYLYSGATDVARLCDDAELFESLKNLFYDVINTKMYVTGAIGAHSVSERFSVSYDLPSDRAYAETCASIGLALWAMRMLKVELNEDYAATMERALYNTLLSGVSMDGVKYFYVNPLCVVPDVTEFRFDTEHVKTERVEWFGCACCPPNIARTLATFGKFIYTEMPDGYAINLFIDSALTCEKGDISLKGSIFDDGKLILSAPLGTTVYIRIPSWADSVNIEGIKVDADCGYYRLSIEKQEYQIDINFKPTWIYADPRVSDCAGKVALQYGPFIYCAEEADNGKNLSTIFANTDGNVQIVGEMDGLPVLSVDAFRCNIGNILYNKTKPTYKLERVKMLPYCLWNNRGRGEMRVWLNKK